MGGATQPFSMGTPDNIKQLMTRIQQQIDELYQDRIGGAQIGDVFYVGDDETLALGISAIGGLVKVGNVLSVYPSVTRGINIDPNGVYVLLDPAGGLTVSPAGLAVTTVDPVKTVTVTHSDFVSGTGAAYVAILTIPKKCKIIGVYCNTTEVYTGGAISAVTLKVGLANDGVELIASHDVRSGTSVKGGADAEMGTSMVRSALVQGGFMPSWLNSVNVILSLNTTGGNINELTTGSTTVYIRYDQY